MAILKEIALPSLFLLATFIGFGIKKYIETISESMAKDWYVKRKEK